MKSVVRCLHLISWLSFPSSHPCSASFFFLGAHGLLLPFFLALCCFPALIFPPLTPLHPLGPWWRGGTLDPSEPAGRGRQKGGRDNRLGSRFSVNICAWKTQVGDGEGRAPSVEACILPEVPQGLGHGQARKKRQGARPERQAGRQVSTQKESFLRDWQLVATGLSGQSAPRTGGEPGKAP